MGEIGPHLVLWTSFIKGGILITLLLQKKCPLNSMEMCKITWVVLWTKYSHGFISNNSFISKKMSLELSGDV